MLILIRNEHLDSGIVLKIRSQNTTSCPDNTWQDRKEKHYHCLFARPGRVLRACITVPEEGALTVGDLLQLLSKDQKGRQFLKGFQSSGRRLHDISLDERTDVKALQDSRLV